MWVKNILPISQTLRKREKVVVLKPGCVADVDLPENANLTKMGLEVLKLAEPSLVGGCPAEIVMTKSNKGKVSARGNTKRGRRNGNR